MGWNRLDAVVGVEKRDSNNLLGVDRDSVFEKLTLDRFARTLMKGPTSEKVHWGGGPIEIERVSGCGQRPKC